MLDAVEATNSLQAAAATFAGIVRLQPGGRVMMGEHPASDVAPHLAHHFGMLVAMFEGAVTDLSDVKHRLTDSTPGVQESVRAAHEAACSQFATVVAALRQLEDVTPTMVGSDGTSVHSLGGNSSFTSKLLTGKKGSPEGINSVDADRRTSSTHSMQSLGSLDQFSGLKVRTGSEPGPTAARAVRRARAAVNEAAAEFQAFEASCWVSVPMLLNVVPTMAKAKVRTCQRCPTGVRSLSVLVD